MALYLTLWVMSKMTKFDKLLGKFDALKNSKNTSCVKLCKLLQDLGFQIRNCGNAGHKVVIHPCISLLENPHFNCGHNEGAAVKTPYINKLYKFVKDHEDEIRKFINGK